MMDALTLDILTSCISKGIKLKTCVREERFLRNKSDKTAEEMEAYVQKQNEVEWAETAAEVASELEMLE